MCNDIEKQFKTDEHTVALYHFDEGKGDKAYDACGDLDLTLRAKEPLWGQRSDGQPTARFNRRDDDANLFLGPINNDKLQLRTCKDAWTIEAWVRYTGPLGNENGKTYVNICSTDEEGFSQPRGPRGGWLFALHTSFNSEGLMPWGRFTGIIGKANSGVMTGSGVTPIKENYRGESSLTIKDENWHHVAWQFRSCDQQHSLFIDGQPIWVFCRPSQRNLINEFRQSSIPFTVGGLLHQQKPPYYLSHCNWDGEICELRISNVLRYATTDHLAIIHKEISPAVLYSPYRFKFVTEGHTGKVCWKLNSGSLPPNLTLDEDSGIIHGLPAFPCLPVNCVISAVDEAGATDKYAFAIEIKSGKIDTVSLPLAFAGNAYRYELQSSFFTTPLAWSIIKGSLPEGIVLNTQSGVIEGVTKKALRSKFTVKVLDAWGQEAEQELIFKVAPSVINTIEADENTVVLYNWQGEDGKFIPDVMGDKELELTWTNMMGDIRIPGRLERKYPFTPGGGEWGFVGPQHNDKLDLRTCREEWTVEAWIKSGGTINHYGQPFDFGHICGTYDNTMQGTWELYIAYDGSSKSSMAPGVIFNSTENGTLLDLNPWKHREGIVVEKEQLGINDTQWHHVAWQYCYKTNTHELLLDGVLIWQISLPKSQQIVNNRTHDAQFSVGTRLNGYARYGGFFNWLGWGNFFGQIGEIRISNICRYTN